MTLLREIQDGAISSDVDLSTLLRKCKVLAARLGHQPFVEWVEHELNGYADVASLPDYRILAVQSRGNFSGDFGSGMRNVLIPPRSLPEQIRDIAREARLRQGIRAYASILERAEEEGCQMPWAADVVAMFGQDIYHNMNCISAWRVIPLGALEEVLDTVRNRILSFVLELEKLAPDAGEAQPGQQPVAQEKVANVFNVTVLGGTSVITSESSNVNVAIGAEIKANDIGSLLTYLRGLDVEEKDLAELTEAIAADERPTEPTKLGARVSAWVGKMLGKAASGAWKIAAPAASQLLVKAISIYYGLGA